MKTKTEKRPDEEAFFLPKGSLMKYDIGIIGAMDAELEELICALEERNEKTVSGITYHFGKIFGKSVVIAKCGVGKVFAAACVTAMAVVFSPALIINTGVGGGLKKGISVCDLVIGEKICQHDMDTSPIGDPEGLISGINKVYFESDGRIVGILSEAARDLGFPCHKGIIATGDQFVASSAQKERIVSLFSASVCEMEGGAVAQAAYLAGIPFAVVRAVSDSADEGSSMDYMKFLPIAAKRSSALVFEFIKRHQVN